MKSCNPDVYEQVVGRSQFSTLTRLIDIAGLGSALSGTIGITIFAPTNAAFDKVPKKTLDGLINNPEALKKILRYHVIPEVMPIHSLDPEKERQVETLLRGRSLSVYRLSDGEVEINRFNKLIGSEIYGLNGIVLPIDGVLMPM